MSIGAFQLNTSWNSKKRTKIMMQQGSRLCSILRWRRQEGEALHEGIVVVSKLQHSLAHLLL